MTFADAEALSVAFLKPIASPEHVGTKVPNPRPKRLVRAYRSGGSAINRVLERAQITVEAEAETSTKAFQLASACREAFLNDYTRMPLVRGVEETVGLYYVPDPATNIDRYRFTVALTIRAAR
ncbi:MAG TPA: hypothetical protein VNJ54_07945 [Plantibacter sp.]|uniref:hypothetical protein n=1 Tax=Plantibacter sp. TaxID=1871045 RepID=UPI002D022D66|nr:hypothetical protein [Plantibacter sp.]